MASDTDSTPEDQRLCAVCGTAKESVWGELCTACQALHAAEKAEREPVADGKNW
jgi:hypothetical protein